MRGRAIGIAGLGQRLGQIAFPVMIERIIAFGTWRNAAVAIGITVWVSALLPTLLLLRRQPEDHGQHPDGALPDLRHGTSTRGRARPRVEVSFGWSEVVRTPAFFILAGPTPWVCCTGFQPA